MMRLYSLWLALALVPLTLESCTSVPVDIPDFVVCGWIGPVGGSLDNCSCVHTNSSSVAPIHYTLNECLNLLNGAIFIQGSNFNSIVVGRDELCVETGSCTYEQAQAAKKLNYAIDQIQKVNPHR
jgi:hypothetical protein